MTNAQVVRFIDLAAAEATIAYNQICAVLTGIGHGFFHKWHLDPEYQCYVVKVDDQYVGAYAFCLRTANFKSGECTSISVEPSIKRKGYGSLLVKAMKARYVLVGDTVQANSFWRAMGYRSVPWGTDKQQCLNNEYPLIM